MSKNVGVPKNKNYMNTLQKRKNNGAVKRTDYSHTTTNCRHQKHNPPDVDKNLNYITYKTENKMKDKTYCLTNDFPTAGFVDYILLFSRCFSCF